MIDEKKSGEIVAQRTAQGRSGKEIERYLKRYLVREIYPLILADLAAAAKTSCHRSVNAPTEYQFTSFKNEYSPGIRDEAHEKMKAAGVDWVEVFYH